MSEKYSDTSPDTYDESNPDIIDGYMIIRKKLIIYISALSGIDLGKICEMLSNDLKIKVMSEKKFYKDDLKEITLSDGKKIKNIFDFEAVDWVEFNKNAGKLGRENRGIIIYGMMFPKDKIARPDIHIHLKISPEKLFEKRQKYILEHTNDFHVKKEDIIKYLQMTYDEVERKFYKDLIEKSFINKFIKIDDKTDDEITDEIFNEIIKFIESVVHK